MGIMRKKWVLVFAFPKHLEACFFIPKFLRDISNSQVLRLSIECVCSDTWWEARIGIGRVRFGDNNYHVNMYAIGFIVDLCLVNSGSFKESEKSV